MRVTGRHPVLQAAFLALLATGLRAAASDEERIVVPSRSSSGASAPAPSISGSASSASLFLGLALAAAGGWLVWRNRQRVGTTGDKRLLEIEETRPLGNRQYLVVASYEGRRYLLGVCPGRIEMLTALEAEPVRREER